MDETKTGTWRPAIGWGVRLREARRSYGALVTQVEFAELAGVTKGTYEAWESGRNTPPFKRMVEVADRLQARIGLDRGFLLDLVPPSGKVPRWAARDSNPEPAGVVALRWYLPVPGGLRLVSLN